MRNTIEKLHQASQYLAAASISFLDKKADDSHTNLGWNTALSRIESHPLDAKGNQLVFDLKSSQLAWLKNSVESDKINLENNSHAEITSWIKDVSRINGIEKEFKYSFHYDLPYASLSENHQFSFDKSQVETYINRQDIAQEAFESFLTVNDLKSDIRIWPHHFDLGIYFQIDDEGKNFVGAGLAVPDTLVDDMYFYSSGHKNGDSIKTSEFKGLTKGDWRKDWEGATLASENINSDSALTFLNETKIGFQ